MGTGKRDAEEHVQSEILFLLMTVVAPTIQMRMSNRKRIRSHRGYASVVTCESLCRLYTKEKNPDR